MSQQFFNRLPSILMSLTVSVSALVLTQPAQAADHSDTPLLSSIGRNDAKLTDLYAFKRGENLVMIVGVNPAIPPSASDFVFPTDVTYRINIDNDRPVRFDDQDDLKNYGGTIVRPKKIREDIAFEITFNDDNQPQLKVKGVHPRKAKRIADEAQLFTGLRDDPFIVKPRLGRNVAAIVLELPIHYVLKRHSYNDVLLLWATSNVEGVNAKVVDVTGRAFLSSFPENDAMNTMHPRFHQSQLGVNPDVMIYDVSKPAVYPNGRTLTDDVATIIADPRIVAIDDPSPTENDVPFLDVFPYLAAPQ